VVPVELSRAAREGRLVLFVGAGVSAGLGLPTWGELMNSIAEELEFDEDVFRLHGDALELAEYYQIMRGTLGPLRSRLDVAWHRDESIVDNSRVHQAIVSLAPNRIYTTNFDRLIELAFERRGVTYQKVTDIGSMASADPTAIQVVKYHGDFESDESLVLAESRFFDRLTLEHPLDIKFRNDCLGRVVLFLGYSLSDINIRYLLYQLQLMWRGSPKKHLRPKSFIYMARPNPVRERIFESRGISPIVSAVDDRSEGLASFMEELAAEGHR